VELLRRPRQMVVFRDSLCRKPSPRLIRNVRASRLGLSTGRLESGIRPHADSLQKGGEGREGLSPETFGLIEILVTAETRSSTLVRKACDHQRGRLIHGRLHRSGNKKREIVPNAGARKRRLTGCVSGTTVVTGVLHKTVRSLSPPALIFSFQIT